MILTILLIGFAVLFIGGLVVAIRVATVLADVEAELRNYRNCMKVPEEQVDESDTASGVNTPDDDDDIFYLSGAW